MERPADDQQAGEAPVPAGRRGHPSLIRNVFSNWVGLGSAVIYSLVITPIVIRGLEREAYGIWSFLNGLVAYSGLLYVGLGSALIKFVAHYYAVDDRAALNRLVSVVLTVYVGLGLITLAVGLGVAPFVPGLLLTASAVTPSTTVSLTVVVLAARLSMMFVGSVFSGVLVAQGRTDRYRMVTIAGHAGRLFLVPMAVRAHDPLLALAMVVAVTGAVEVAAMVVIALRQDRALKCHIVVPLAAELSTLYGFGLLAFLLQVADKLISYTDTTIIGLLLGPREVALYVLPLQLAEYGRIAVLGLVSAILPHLSALLATGRREHFRLLYQRVLKTTALVAVFVNVSILWLGQDFLRRWVGLEFSEAALPVIIALSIASLAQAIAVQSQIPFCLALSRVRFAAIVLIGEGLANLGLSIALAPHFGINGVATATAITAFLISGAVLPIYVAGQVGAPLRDLVRHVAAPIATFFVAVAVGHVVLRLAMPGDSYFVLAARFSTGSLIAAFAGWKVASDSERRVIRVFLARRRRMLLGWAGRR